MRDHGDYTPDTTYYTKMQSARRVNIGKNKLLWTQKGQFSPIKNDQKCYKWDNWSWLFICLSRRAYTETMVEAKQQQELKKTGESIKGALIVKNFIKEMDCNFF